MRRLRQVALVVAVVVALVLFGAWQGLIWVSERTAAFSGRQQPVCGSPAGGDRFGRAVQRASGHVHAMMAERRIPGLAVAVAAATATLGTLLAVRVRRRRRLAG
jgi:hypothetical protein